MSKSAIKPAPKLKAMYSSPDAFDTTLRTLVNCLNEEFDELQLAINHIAQQMNNATEDSEKQRFFLLGTQYQMIAKRYKKRLVRMIQKGGVYFIEMHLNSYNNVEENNDYAY